MAIELFVGALDLSSYVLSTRLLGRACFVYLRSDYTVIADISELRASNSLNLGSIDRGKVVPRIYLKTRTKTLSFLPRYMMKTFRFPFMTTFKFRCAGEEIIYLKFKEQR